MGADPREDDEPREISTLTALSVLEIVELLNHAIDRYVDTAKREERRRWSGLPF
jgi:diacylglycerol kinase